MFKSYDNLCKLLQPRDGDVVAVIGAGGKHTLMVRLGEELAAAGRQVVLTSTTNLHRGPDRAGVATLVTAGCDQWPDMLAVSLKERGVTIAVASELGPNMYRGFEPDAIDRICAAVPKAVVVVKADGARKRLLKAPGSDEPVFSPRTNLCVLVMSLDAVGRPLDHRYVHRLEHVRRLTDGDRISTRTLIDVISKPMGYAGRLPMQARRILYLSCCNSPEAQEHAQVVFKATPRLFDARICGDTIGGKYYA